MPRLFDIPLQLITSMSLFAFLFSCSTANNSATREVVKSINDDLPLAYFDDKPVRATDLPISKQAEIHDLEEKRFELLLKSTQEEIIKRYIAREAKKANKPPAQFEKEVLEPKPLTEQDIKNFYEANKAKIPYPFDFVKYEVKRQAMEDAKAKRRLELLQKISEEPGTTFALSPPKAPKIAFDTKGFPALTEGNGSHELVQFLDYLCPHCKEIEPEIQSIAKKHGKRLRIVAVDFPLHDNPLSIQIAKGAFCAHKAGKYPKFREHAIGYFEGKKAFETEFPKLIKENPKTWQTCLNSKEADEHMRRSKIISEKLDVLATPTFYLDGRRIPGQSLERKIRDTM